MRLKSVSISAYKNLKDFSLTFDGDGFIDIFVGKNGSGKSNFLEALISIFDHVYDDNRKRNGPKFNYEISWDIDGVESRVSWQDQRCLINGLGRGRLEEDNLPSNIIIYYSGQNTTVAELVNRHRARYRRKIKKAAVVESPRFFGIGPEYKSLLLSLMLMLPEHELARKYLVQKLGIEFCGETALLTLKRPAIARKGEEFDPRDERQVFWGASGIVRRFLDKLLDCIPGEFNRGDLYDRKTDTYTLGLSVEKFRNVFDGVDRATTFAEFNALHTLGMIKDIAIPVHLNANTQVSSRAFSDGQFQSVYIFAISEIFKNRNCITLLDEPDAFLHPEWQFDFLKQTHAISDQAAKSNHILMSSHSAATLISDISQKVRYFDLKDGSAHCYLLPKRVAVEKLSSNIIRYSEQEQLLSMINAIQIENKPVFFTEGSIDPIIIKEAWYRLYETEIPFIPFYAFSCTYLKQLLMDERISNEMNGLPIFGLFDLDKAYDQWNGLKGDMIELDPYKGRAKKLENRNVFALLLPVPVNVDIRAQVIKVHATGECFGGDSLCEIEHLFYGDASTAEFFDREPTPGGGSRVIVKSDAQKKRFAEDIIPKLPDAYFEVLRPMFDLIVSKVA